MTDREAFIQSIIAAPDDDLPRLVFADWLDEHDGQTPCGKCMGTGSHSLNPYELAQRYGTHNAGKILDAARCGACGGVGRVANAERAEFIRLQVELAGPDELHWNRNPLRYRTADLLDAHAAEWCKPLDVCGFGGYGEVIIRHYPHLPHGQRPMVTFRRGFIDSVRCPLADWLAHGRAVCQGNPVERVSLSDREPDDDASTGESYHWWDDPGGADGVPQAIFDLLPNAPACYDWGEFRKGYDTRQAAIDALSAACIAWARSPEPAVV